MMYGLPRVSADSKTIVKFFVENVEGSFSIHDDVIHDVSQNDFQLPSMTFDDNEQSMCFVGFGNDFDSIKVGDKLIGENGSCTVREIYFFMKGNEQTAPSAVERALIKEINKAGIPNSTYMAMS